MKVEILKVYMVGKFMYVEFMDEESGEVFDEKLDDLFYKNRKLWDEISLECCEKYNKENNTEYDYRNV